ncbi:hypothetical protein SEPCBS119000_003657 [Sporothrix epigloea]|uniref:HNH nuclease domain-containing protein n=1 Tax=Sporothrix epigloea TaxID=1892477 RepID=A0ABP0DPM9_9PEZI
MSSPGAVPSPGEELLVERLRRAYRRDKQAADAGVTLIENVPEAVKVFASDIPFEFERPQDYISDVEERQRLFSKIRPLISQTVQVNSTVLAIFMVCPLSELRLLAESLAEYDPLSEEDRERYKSSSTRESIESGLKHAAQAVAGFLTKPTSSCSTKASSAATTPESTGKERKRQADAAQPETPSPLRKRVLAANTEGQPLFEAGESRRQNSTAVTPSPPEKTRKVSGSPATRNCSAVKRAKARDGHLCVLSGSVDPEAAHIYPFSAGQDSERTEYIANLACFWGKERADAWSRQFRSAHITESPKNLLCLNRQLHFWWGACRLALRPIRSLDPCAIKLQVHWLRRSITRPRSLSSENFKDISSLCGGGPDYQSWGQSPAAYRRSGLPLQTGQIFTIRADSTEDLPSFDLLDMQWNLLRVAAMSGAAEADTDPWGREDEEDDYAGGYVLPNDLDDLDDLDDDVEYLDLYQTEEDKGETA